LPFPIENSRKFAIGAWLYAGTGLILPIFAAWYTL